MSRLLERWKREKEEKEQRRIEREKRKTEREKEKERKKKEAKKKRKKSAENRKYYKKVRAKQLKERKDKGDEYGYFMVLVMKDCERFKKVGISYWKTGAYKLFNDEVEKNRKEVSYPQLKISDGGVLSNSSEYEIIIVQLINDDDKDMISHFRDKDGRFIEHIITDSDKYKIIDKADWFVDETFAVYGYHPINDRKNFAFIADNIVMKDVRPDTARRVFVYKNKVVIQYDSTFDFVQCKSNKEAERLYDALYKKADGNKYIIFTGRSPRGISTWLLNELEQITGWKRNVL